MAAPLGFKTFNSGDVLTAADTNGYLMQGVWTFANAAARTAAVTSPQEGNVSFLKDTNSLEIYDGAAWVAYGSGDITGVTAGTGITGGGTSGTVTITNDMATKIDAKGDLIIGTGADTYDRLAVGTNGHVLTADSTTSTGTKWSAVAGGAYTLISTTSLSTASTQISFTSTGYTQIVAYIYGAYASSASELTFTLNNNTTADYMMAWTGRSGGGAYTANTSGGVAYFRASGTENYGSAITEKTENHCTITILDPANTGTLPKVVQTACSAFNASGQQFVYSTVMAKKNLNAAISSIEIKTTAGTWSAGTVLLYGVK